MNDPTSSPQPTMPALSRTNRGGQVRLLVVQYAGDYREAYRDVFERGRETYHAQRYAIESITDIGQKLGTAGFLCCRTSEAYDVVLPNGLRAMGAAVDPYKDVGKVIEMVARFDPTHIVIHVPIPGLLRWATRQKIKTLALFANYFPSGSVLRRVRHYLLARILNDPHIEWVANHNTGACLSTRQIGVFPDKIIAWDWPHSSNPSAYEPKTSPAAGPVLAYVGLIDEVKGVGDLIRAVADLRARGFDVRARIAGSGEVAHFQSLAREIGVADQVDFLGLIAHHSVVTLMRDADVVVVPSQHRYPEGLPLTIYEALCSRTPLVVSDHPMFTAKLVDRSTALIYPAGQPRELAARIQELLSDNRLYATLSRASAEAWERLQIPVKWGELIARWVNDTPADQDWLKDHRLTKLFHQRYGGTSGLEPDSSRPDEWS